MRAFDRATALGVVVSSVLFGCATPSGDRQSDPAVTDKETATVAKAPAARASCPPWEGDAESASKFLARTDQITTSAPIGDGGDRSMESRAFMKLYHSEKPGDSFAQLYRDATSAGKFWALLGLRFLRDKREAELRDDFMSEDRGMILFFPGGCEGAHVDPRKELPVWLERVDGGELQGLVETS